MALVSVADRAGRKNVFTVAWVGTVCSDPPMVSISVRPQRYSYKPIVYSQRHIGAMRIDNGFCPFKMETVLFGSRIGEPFHNSSNKRQAISSTALVVQVGVARVA